MSARYKYAQTCKEWAEEEYIVILIALYYSLVHHTTCPLEKDTTDSQAVNTSTNNNQQLS